jgi:small subunit ribosomal protein S21
LVSVAVHANNMEQALRALKKKMQREGIFREMKLRRHYEKGCDKRKRKESEGDRRRRKLIRKRTQEGV